MIYEKHIFICTNYRENESRCSCGNNASDEIRLKFVELIKQNKLSNKIRSNKSGCMNLCEYGPVIVIYPQAIWYVNVKINDVVNLKIKKKWIQDIPVGRIADPEEIAYLATFLASEYANYINGVNLPIDGGKINSF